MGVMEPADCLKVLTRSAFESYPQTIESDPPPARVRCFRYWVKSGH
jgi:hypothetical protein